MSAVPSLTPPLPWRWLLLLAGGLGAVLWAWWYSGFAPGRLWSTATIDAVQVQMQRVVRAAPDAADAARAGKAALTTLALATAGSALAAVVALLLLPLAAASLTVHPAVAAGAGWRRWVATRFLHHGARVLANVLRTTPYLIWGLLLLLLLGPGPLPAALALALHTAGVLSWLWASAVDTIDPAPQRALAAAGAGRLARFFYAVLPQARATLAGLWLYRWEINLREATVLGMVASGGLGQELTESYAYFDHGRLAATLLMLLVLVLAGEALSATLRARLR
jgi:phosphonate transport system permease protein